MKFSRKEILSREYKIPEIRFEDQSLTSYSGLIIFQPLFSSLKMKEAFRRCFQHLRVREIFGHHIIMMVLVVHLLLGYRKLREMEYYREDPLVKRLLGLKRLPDVSTVSRVLRSADSRCIGKVREFCRKGVIEALKKVYLYRLTLDFDGSVVSTNGRNKEGTAVGYNNKKKGLRSYYPLFCTIAQTGQVFDVYHRPGNVHDSKGAREFIIECISMIKKEMPWVTIEV
ncbi:MAG: transposase, partial [Thermodesulfovibrionales bacterium]